MSEFKHTPGPWSTYVEKWPNKIVIRSMFTDGTERAQVAVTSAENAHLIAAAPDLLEACMLARHICEDGNALQQQLDAAIAKATGGEG